MADDIDDLTRLARELVKNAADIRKRYQHHAEEAFEFLIRVVRGEVQAAQVQIAACREILEQGLGRTMQALPQPVSENENGPAKLAQVRPDVIARLVKMSSGGSGETEPE